jgi:hypothetical protein
MQHREQTSISFLALLYRDLWFKKAVMHGPERELQNRHRSGGNQEGVSVQKIIIRVFCSKATRTRQRIYGLQVRDYLSILIEADLTSTV